MAMNFGRICFACAVAAAVSGGSLLISATSQTGAKIDIARQQVPI
jgi:hypothetical protein